MAPGRLYNRDGWILTAMVATEFSNVGVNTLVKVATSKGVNPFVVLVYSHSFASLPLLPLTFLSLRSRSLPPLTSSIVCKMGLYGLIASVFQIAGYNGIKYSSPTLSSAMSNVNPAFTFILAVVFRMENISLRKESSIAKVLGTIVSIIGALVVTLYHGPMLMSSHSDWVIGGGLLALQFILMISISYLVMAHIMNLYPSAVLLTLVHNVFIAVVSVFVSLLAEKDNSKTWIIRSNITLFSILAAGILTTGYTFIHLWAVSHKGPVFLSMFKPLSILIAAASTAIFLGESLYLGSLIGGILISIGFYMVLWGKQRKTKMTY
ncbi:WAT1-related protein [Cardamine amara subsp. amara]|uniref:WAT1-related protein n=1 Tax=Cardamine amara subsp. amara TaxID=228776 RepID=A0ABD1A191_CARAN